LRKIGIRGSKFRSRETYGRFAPALRKIGIRGSKFRSRETYGRFAPATS
jgi:hypothetical protein